MRQLETGSRTVSLLLLASALLVPLASGFTAGAVSLPLKAVVFAVLIVTVWRPADGLAVVAGLAPLAGLLVPIGRVPPIRLAEAFVLAFLCGWLVRSALGARRHVSPALWLRAVLFAVIILASCAVELAALQIATDYPGAFIQRAWTFLHRVFLLPSGDFPSLTAAALLLEGVGLLAATWTLAVDDRDLPRRLLTVTVATGLAVAVLAIVKLECEFFAGTYYAPTGISAHVSDVNAAGSYLAMVLPIVLAQGMTLGWRPLALAGTGAIGAALWLTGSKAAIVIGGPIVMPVIAWRTWSQFRSSGRLPVPTVAVAVGLVISVGIATLVVMRGGAELRVALNSRVEFVQTSLRMIATRPWFGIGIGRYYLSSGAFMPPRLHWNYRLENAHNNFLQIGAELGLVGLASFLWLLAVVFAQLWKGLRARPDNLALAGIFAGLSGFLVTCLMGHPLLVPEVAYPFWMTLGIAAVTGAVDQPRAVPGGRARRRRASMVLCVAVVLASVPIRIASETRAMDLSQVTYGLSEPEQSRAGVTFRRVNGEATFFVRGDVRAIELPLALADATPGEATEVEVALDGRPANRVRVDATGWTRMRVLIPRTSAGRPFRRLDLRVVCPGGAGSRQTCPGLRDERLAIGDITPD